MTAAPNEGIPPFVYRLIPFATVLLQSLQSGTLRERYEELKILDAPSLTFDVEKRKYELIPIFRRGETVLTAEEVLQRATEKEADLGGDHSDVYVFLMNRQEMLPAYLRGMLNILLPGYRERHDHHRSMDQYTGRFCRIHWETDERILSPRFIDTYIGHTLDRRDRLIRRLK